MALPLPGLPVTGGSDHLPGNRTDGDESKGEFWDGLSARWIWVADEAMWFCADPSEYDGPGITEPGALPPERLPYYAFPPNEAQQIAREIAIEQGEEL